MVLWMTVIFNKTLIKNLLKQSAWFSSNNLIILYWCYFKEICDKLYNEIACIKKILLIFEQFWINKSNSATKLYIVDYSIL